MTSPVVTRCLIPLDGTPLAAQALPYARALAVPPAELLLLKVVPAPEPVRGLLANAARPADEAGQESREEARRWLEAQAASLRRDMPEVDVGVAVGVGQPAEEILRVAHEWKADLVVLASHARGTIGRLVWGSVADQVTSAAAVPVVIVRPGDVPPTNGPARIRRLLVPLDRKDLAAEVLPRAAARLAQRLRLRVHLVAIVDGHERRPDWRLEGQLEGESAELGRLGARATWEILAESPTAAVKDAAFRSDLIVVRSSARDGWKHWIPGGLAERLIHGGPAPVLLLPASWVPT